MNSTETFQRAFTQYLRAPSKYALPQGVPAERAKIYTELLFNNIFGTLKNAFPVLYQLYGENKWQILVRHFYENMQCHTPQLNHIGHEFVQFLDQHYVKNSTDVPYLTELAYYEWLEVKVMLSPEEGIQGKTHKNNIKAQDLLAHPSKISPLAEIGVYDYPVHQISKKNPNPDNKPTCLAVYRTEKNQVKFMELNLFSAGLLAYFQGNMHHSTQSLIQQWLNDLKTQVALTEALQVSYQAHAEHLLWDLYQKDIVILCQPTP